MVERSRLNWPREVTVIYSHLCDDLGIWERNDARSSKCEVLTSAPDALTLHSNFFQIYIA